jgi:hypothetical protein
MTNCTLRRQMLDAPSMRHQGHREDQAKRRRQHEKTIGLNAIRRCGDGFAPSQPPRTALTRAPSATLSLG